MTQQTFKAYMLEQIDRLRGIVSRWPDEGAVASLERELLLGKLRQVYEAALFPDAFAVSCGDLPRPEAEAADNISPASIPQEPSFLAPEPETEFFPEAPSVAAEQKLFSDESHVRPRLDKQVILSLYGDGDSAPPAVQPAAAPGPEPVSQPEPEPTVEPVAEEPSEALSATGPVEVSYEPEIGDPLPEDAPVSDEAANETTDIPEVATPLSDRPSTDLEASEVSRLAPDASHLQSEPRNPAAFQGTAPADKPLSSSVVPGNGNGSASKVLGEVIGTAGPSLGEVLGQQQPHSDLASRLRASVVTDLHHSIGINDRFLLIKELFGGDSLRYEQTLSRLNEFTDLDGAMIYIQENFSWNPDAEATTLLIDLLERKLDK